MAGAAQDLEPEALPLRPRGVGDLIDAAVELLRARFVVYLGLAALILAPVRVVNYYAFDRFSMEREPGIGEILGFLAATTGLPLLVQNLISALVILVVHAQLLGRRMPASEALGVALRRLPALVFLLVLIGLILVGGALLPVVAAVICFPLLPLVLVVLVVLGWKLYLATPALMLEGLGPVAAIRRSVRLSEGSLRRWLGVYALSWLLAAFFSGLAAAADDPTVRAWVLEPLGLSRALFDPLYLFISTLLSAVGLSFTAVVATAFYLDARMRREAFDLELRLERLRLDGAPA